MSDVISLVRIQMPTLKSTSAQMQLLIFSDKVPHKIK